GGDAELSHRACIPSRDRKGARSDSAPLPNGRGSDLSAAFLHNVPRRGTCFLSIRTAYTLRDGGNAMSSAGERRRRPEDPAEPRTREPDASDTEVAERRPKFFLAVFTGGFSEARIFRAYPEADGISFVYAGLPALFVDPELARGEGRDDWKVKAGE